ncbi:hypothetical protein BpHYR1_049441 [Brachionus plicatilis]|uniref:Uncharacterized protein n=1 Tax=Brachionus plicatilis TaxID=10195 RepID=A0A3M7P1W7_BRAPC|nr:hypothetical protein BpHYR1_049441 [Brachionus plicatilis]
MEKIDYFDLNKCIILFYNYKLHKVASNADGSICFRCQTCKSISVTVDKTDLICRKLKASSRHLGQCKKYSTIQTICRKKYEEIKHDTRTEPSFSFSKGYGEGLQQLQGQYDPQLVAQYYPKEPTARVTCSKNKSKISPAEPKTSLLDIINDPKQFYQILTVHAVIDKITYVRAYIFLENKNTSTFIIALEQLRNIRFPKNLKKERLKSQENGTIQTQAFYEQENNSMVSNQCRKRKGTEEEKEAKKSKTETGTVSIEIKQ